MSRRFALGLAVAASGLAVGVSTATAFRGANGAAAFERNVTLSGSGQLSSEIFRVDPDGTDVLNLTNNEFGDYTPMWSPDGERIVFATNRFCGVPFCRLIEIINADGSNAQFPQGDDVGIVRFDPRWSPDGTRIAYIGDYSHRQQPWVMDANGTHPRRLAPESDYVIGMSWAPDGRRLIFGRQVLSAVTLYVANANGTGLKPLVSGVWPEWSPAGSTIIYLAGTAIKSVHPDGTGVTPLYDSPAYKTAPRFSPDGTRILFNARVAEAPTDVFNIFIMDADGDNVTNITDDDTVSELGLQWSPDGTKVLIREADGDLGAMDVTGANRVSLGPGTNPDWQPRCTIDGTPADDSIVGTSGPDVICGVAGNDTIDGLGGDDVVFGGLGNDRIAGGVGRDTIVGQAGNDVLTPGPDDDLVVGAAGIDTVSFFGATHGITVSFAQLTATGEGADTVLSLERVVGSSLADWIYASGASNQLSGGGGADHLYGLGGADSLLGGPGGDFLYGGVGKDSLNGGPGRDLCRQGAGAGRSIGCER